MCESVVSQHSRKNKGNESGLFEQPLKFYHFFLLLKVEPPGVNIKIKQRRI